MVNSVGNLAHVHFASNIFALPLKTKDNPRGIFTEHELFMCFVAIFTTIFFDLDPAKSFPLRQASRAVAQQLGQIVEAYVKSVKATGLISKVVDRFRANKSGLEEYGVHMIRKLLDSGLSIEAVTWSQVMPTAGAMIPNQSQVVSMSLLCACNLLTGSVHSNYGLLPLRRRQGPPPRDPAVGQDG